MRDLQPVWWKNFLKKSSIKHDFVRFGSIFDPAVILSCEMKLLQKWFKSFLNQFMISKILSPNQCDSILLEFTSSIDNKLKKYRAKVKKSLMKTTIDWMIFVLTKFLPKIMLIFHLLSKLFLPLAMTRHSQSNNLASTTQY